MKRLLTFVFAALVATGCATTQAKVKSPDDHPPMEVPPPPPRMIEPVPLPAPPPDPVADLPASPATSKPRPQTPREPAKPVETPKIETPPVEVPPATPPQTVPPLRTSATPDEAATKQVREIIDRANTVLGGVDYRYLNRQQRSQYDSAKLFLKQAEESLKAANYDFARNLADKAERIAKELPGK